MVPVAEKRELTRCEPVTTYDESEEEVLLSKGQRFKMESIFPVLDSLITKITKHAEACSLIRNRFSFFIELKTIGCDDLNKV